MKPVFIATLIVMLATTGLAQWTNAWHPSWTNSPGWLSYRVAKDVDAMTRERVDAVVGDYPSWSPNVPVIDSLSLWPTRKWLRQIDANLQALAPYYVDHIALTNLLATNGVPLPPPMWTFSNICFAAGMVNSNFTRPANPYSTNSPAWPRIADLEERRAVGELMQATYSYVSRTEHTAGGQATLETTNAPATAEEWAEVIYDASVSTNADNFSGASVAWRVTQAEQVEGEQIVAYWWAQYWEVVLRSSFLLSDPSTNLACRAEWYAWLTENIEDNEALYGLPGHVAENVPRCNASDSAYFVTNVLDWYSWTPAWTAATPTWAHVETTWKPQTGIEASLYIGNTNLAAPTTNVWATPPPVSADKMYSARGWNIGEDPDDIYTNYYGFAWQPILSLAQGPSGGDITYAYAILYWNVTNGFVYQ